MASRKKGITETALVLRTCSADMKSYGGFQWPDEVGAVVEAPDWKANNECGNGLHGWLFGHGDHSCSSSVMEAGAKWLVVEVALPESIALGGKVKFQRCIIRHIGDKASATEFILSHEPRSAEVAVIGASRQVGDNEIVQVGAIGTASAGDYGTASAGDYGTASAGNGGTASAGDGGTASAGYKGTASAGNGGTASAGDGGTASAGYKGTASAGNGGTASAGNGGEIHIRYWDAKAERYRTAVGYIGEKRLKPNTPYKLNDQHRFVQA
ncbi:Ice nucleation protein [compost metagenome]